MSIVFSGEIPESKRTPTIGFIIVYAIGNPMKTNPTSPGFKPNYKTR